MTMSKLSGIIQRIRVYPFCCDCTYCIASREEGLDA